MNNKTQPADVGAQPAPALQPEALRIAIHLRQRAQLSRPGNLDTLYASGANELERQHADLATAQAEAKHWRSNHDNVVARLRIFTQRPDIPKELADRLPWYRELVRLQAVEAQLSAIGAGGVESLRKREQKEFAEVVAMMTAIGFGVEPADAEAALPSILQACAATEACAALQAAPPAPAAVAVPAVMTHAEAAAAIAINSALHRIREGNAAGAIEPLEQARAALAAAPAQAQDDRAAFKAYLQECDDCENVPDVAGAFHAAWQKRAAQAQAVPSGMGTIWESLPGYLIDHCEGEIISEEGLQRALVAMLENPQYSMPPAAPAQAWSSECDSPELCQVHRGCAGQYGTKKTCHSFAVLNPCNPAAPAQAVAVAELDMDRVLSIADVHAEESREDGTRLLDRGGLVAFAKDVLRVAGTPAQEHATQLAMPILAQH